jgi:hypothetical protein
LPEYAKKEEAEFTQLLTIVELAVLQKCQMEYFAFAEPLSKSVDHGMPNLKSEI